MRTIFYIQRRFRFRGTWEKIPLQNPNIIDQKPIQIVKSQPSKSDILFVCGLGLLGSLGLPRYYNPEKADKLKTKEIQANTFRRVGVFDKNTRVKDISCGYGFTVVAAKVSESQHTAFGFGLNSHSQLGYHESRPGYPLEIVVSPSPIHLDQKSKVIKVACGRSHSILLCDNGLVYGLGNNSLGQCGRPINKDEIYFGSKSINIIDGLPKDIVSVECGQDHSFFLTSQGKLYSCGWGADGQTGLGHYETEHIPSQVKGAIEDAKIIKVSSYADTVMAMDDEGNLYGWGNTEYAQFRIVGNEENEQFNLPRKLKISSNYGRIIDFATGGTICIILNDKGMVFVWGFGILGLGPKVDQLSFPTQVPQSLFDGTKIVSVYAGLTHFAAINEGGELFTWGKNRGGCLGLSHGMDQYFPWRAETQLARVKNVSLGVDHTCLVASRENY